jgi:D-proline reductase (dithiol) PrdB
MMPRDEEPVRYMERTRAYYRALGYSKDYVWANFDEVPFTQLAKPLREARIGLVTTAQPPKLPGSTEPAGRRLWSGPMDPSHPGLNTDNLAWDRESTHTEDRESYLPIKALTGWLQDGLIGSLADRFHGVPTQYSQRATIEVDAPWILERLREDRVDAALLSAL